MTSPFTADDFLGVFAAYNLAVWPLQIVASLAGSVALAGPMFGVAPCPTTLFTIGVLLLARGPWVLRLSIVPILWSLIGIAAALQLGIHEDLGLSVAGAALGSQALGGRRRRGRHLNEEASRRG